MDRDGNMVGSGWVASIPIPHRLFKIIVIPIPFFSKLNRDVPSHLTLFFENFNFLKLLLIF